MGTTRVSVSEFPVKSNLVLDTFETGSGVTTNPQVGTHKAPSDGNGCFVGVTCSTDVCTTIIGEASGPAAAEHTHTDYRCGIRAPKAPRQCINNKVRRHRRIAEQPKGTA